MRRVISLIQLILKLAKIDMSKIQIVSRHTFTANNLFFGSPVRSSYMWENLIIEKRISMNWAYKFYKGSILNDFWSVLSSPLS